MNVIIHQTENGGVAVIYPVGDGKTLNEVAAQSVPAGRPWRIVSTSMLPDRAQRARWQWTFSGPIAIGSDLSPVPQSVSRYQARAALVLMGQGIGRDLLAEADAIVQQHPDTLVRLAWADAQQFERASPYINALAPALGLSPADLDALFRRAATIVA